MIERKDEITNNIGDNISYYRKQFNLTQFELAEILNYSDKSISKWERKESVPDIFVINELANFFGVSVDDFINKKYMPTKKNKRKQAHAYLYALIIWLVVGVTFGIFKIIKIDYPAWKLFIFAIPLSAITLFIFNLVYKKIYYIFIYFTIFIWGLALSLNLIFENVEGYLFYIIMLPIYIFFIYLLYYIYISKKRKRD